MCVLASYEVAGSCIKSSGPWMAMANKTIAESGIARLAGNAEDLDTKGNTPSGYATSSLDSDLCHLVFCWYRNTTFTSKRNKTERLDNQRLTIGTLIPYRVETAHLGGFPSSRFACF